MGKGNIRERLVEVGLRTVLTHGLNATGVKEVVDAAGVPKGSFYYYFTSKEAFAEAVVDRYAESVMEDWQAFLANDGVSPLRRVRRGFEAHLAGLKNGGMNGGCLLGNLSLEVSDHSEAVRCRVRQAFAGWQAGLRKMLEQAQAQGELPDGMTPDALAGFLVNGWEGAIVRAKADRECTALHLFIEFAFEKLLKVPAEVTVAS